jgi:hypothetical protein
MKTLLKNHSRLLAMLLALVLVVSVFGATAFAATSDPNMTAYNGRFTVVVDTSYSEAELQVVPADVNFTATYFTQTGAALVDWELVGTTGDLVVTPASGTGTAVQVGTTGDYYSQLTVGITSGTGSASYLAKNPASTPTANASVNITLVVNDEFITLDDSNTTVSDTLVHVYTSNSVPATPGVSSNPNPDATGMFDPLSAAESIDSRSYVTAMDGLFALQNIGSGGSTGSGSTLTSGSSSLSSLTGTVSNISASGGYVSSITVLNAAGGSATAYSGGWQYRVYDLTIGTAGASGAVYTLSNSSNNLSAVMSAGDYGLSDDQLVIWGFDVNYGNVSFPGTYTLP